MNEDTQPAGPPAAQGESNLPHRILVVDDDKDIRQLSADILKASGFHVDAAEDGAIAWDALQVEKYDLLITDNQMPNISGVELVKKLHSARKALPIIMASGNIPTEELGRQPGLQLAGMLVKPFTGDELLTTVKNVLRVNAYTNEEDSPRVDGQALPSVQSDNGPDDKKYFI
jgi:two-component system, chemotaxis family, chemotaxis protein CheY